MFVQSQTSFDEMSSSSNMPRLREQNILHTFYHGIDASLLSQKHQTVLFVRPDPSPMQVEKTLQPISVFLVLLFKEQVNKLNRSVNLIFSFESLLIVRATQTSLCNSNCDFKFPSELSKPVLIRIDIAN